MNNFTVYGTATNSMGQSMIVTEAFFNSKGTLLLKGYETEVGFNWYTLNEESQRIPVTQGYFDIVKCDWEVEQLVLELTTLKDREVTDVIPVFFDNSGYSRYYSLLTVGDYLEERDNYNSEPVYIASKEDIKCNIKSCSYDLNYDEYLEQKDRLNYILNVIEGNNPEVEYNLAQEYIKSVWYQLNPEDYSSTTLVYSRANDALESIDDLPF